MKTRMKKSIFFLVLCFISLSLYAQQPPAFQDTIPFRNDLGIIIVPITFNGVEKQFAFDTGAQVTLGFSWVKDALKRTSKTVLLTSSNGSTTKMRYYKSGTIQLGSRKVNNHRILKGNDENGIFSCYNIDGVLGVDITKHFNWTIDYEKKILIMSPADYYPEEVKTMHALDFSFKNNSPSVFFEMNGKKIKFLLDTGARESDVKKTDYNFLSIDQYPKVTLYSGFFDANGALTRTHSTILQLPEITSKEVKVTPIVDYGNQKTKIGNNLWRGKRLFMSLKNKELYVSDQQFTEVFLSYDCSAIFKNNKMIVLHIKEDSDAWNLGIRQGDEIKTINGKVFTDLCTLNKYQTKILKENSTLAFVFENGKKVKVYQNKGLTNL